MTEVEQRIPDEKLQQYSNFFELFDSKRTGYIAEIDFGTCMRGLGLCPSEADVNSMVSSIAAEQQDYHQAVSFEQFVRAAEDFRAGMKTESELRLAFQILDKARTGFIEVTELRRMLTTCGEPLKLEEVNEIIAMMKVDSNGRIGFDDFKNLLLRNTSKRSE
eukprot:6980_1